MIGREINRLRADGWPPVANIGGPQEIRPGWYRVELLDVKGELVGDPLEFQATDATAAAAMVTDALRRLRR
jgi:hypothetical protein